MSNATVFLAAKLEINQQYVDLYVDQDKMCVMCLKEKKGNLSKQKGTSQQMSHNEGRGEENKQASI